MNLVNMKLTPSESKEETGALTAQGPAYPYGLSICLDQQALAKLGISVLPNIDTPMTLSARVVVTSVSEYQTQGAEARRSVDLQITEMALGPASVEIDPAKLYPSMQGS